jgi:hypothetical protein
MALGMAFMGMALMGVHLMGMALDPNSPPYTRGCANSRDTLKSLNMLKKSPKCDIYYLHHHNSLLMGPPPDFIRSWHR